MRAYTLLAIAIAALIGAPYATAIIGTFKHVATMLASIN